jgi:hypothetical protein
MTTVVSCLVLGGIAWGICWIYDGYLQRKQLDWHGEANSRGLR